MAYLVLQDGKVFNGEKFGSWDNDDGQWGEVVFNTAMSGYQEMVTDLSYAGQILVFTHPQIGNYGWHDEENEANKVLIKGIIVRELAGGEGSSHADRSVADFCQQHAIRGLKGLDTRALTRHIRQYGTLPGVLVEDQAVGLAYWQRVEQLPQPVNQQWVYQASVREPYEIPGKGPLVAVLDFGAKRNIIRHLQQRGFRLIVFPAWTTAREILDYHPQGLVLSNGPGDPSALPEVITNLRKLLPVLPILGICLGHQLLALAAGGQTYKLKFGHRGGNHPVQDVRTGKATMTAQNHGYAVEEESLKNTGFQVILRNLNDATVEGMEHIHYPIFSVQYHPEAAPGPEENEEIFERFYQMITEGD